MRHEQDAETGVVGAGWGGREVPAPPRKSASGRRRFLSVAATVLVGTAFPLVGGPARAAKVAVQIPAPAVNLADPSARMGGDPQKVVIAGGCFWGTQLVYQHTRGVIQALSGYAGGTAETANYEDSSLGTTGHAQVVEVTFDPAVITYGQLLHIFFSVAHDPTQLDRQGHDVGTQYRSALFLSEPGQKKFAEQYITQLDAAGVHEGRIVTRLEPLQAFYPAEDYHQDYATRHPDSAYVINVDLPMLANLKTFFPQYHRPEPILVNVTERVASKR